MKIRALLVIALLAPATALAAPAARAGDAAPASDRTAYPEILEARAERARLRAEFDRLRLARATARSAAVAAPAWPGRTRVSAPVPATTVAKPDLAIEVRCPSARPDPQAPLVCELVVAAEPTDGEAAPAWEAVTARR